MNQSKRPYYSYLLRLWQEGETSESWRASLQDVSTSSHVGFGSLEELFAFLLELAVRESERPLSQPNTRSEQ